MRFALLAAASRGAFRRSRRRGRRPAAERQLPGVVADRQRADFHATVDTTEATTQPDLFNPNARRAAARRRRGRRPPNCKGTNFGKTVWYDLAPQADRGVVTLQTSAGFPVESSRSTSGTRRTRRSRSSSTAGRARVDELTADVEGKHNYTIQVGGVDGAGGAISLDARLLPGHRRRRHPRRRSTSARRSRASTLRRLPAASCTAVPALRFDPTRQRRQDQPPGGRPRAQGREGRRRPARGCGSQTVKAKKPGTRDAPEARRQDRARGREGRGLKVTLGQHRHGQVQVRRDRQRLRVAGEGRRARHAREPLPRRRRRARSRPAPRQPSEGAAGRRARAGVRRAGAGALAPPPTVLDFESRRRATCRRRRSPARDAVRARAATAAAVECGVDRLAAGATAAQALDVDHGLRSTSTSRSPQATVSMWVSAPTSARAAAVTVDGVVRSDPASTRRWPTALGHARAPFGGAAVVVRRRASTSSP